jgi:negative regulator of replication initiation
MRDATAGALQATAYILETCKKAKSTREIKRKVEALRDWLLSETAKDIESAMPRNPR